MVYAVLVVASVGRMLVGVSVGVVVVVGAVLLVEGLVEMRC